MRNLIRKIILANQSSLDDEMKLLSSMTDEQRAAIQQYRIQHNIFN